MSDDWRERYLKLADESERQQASHAEAERELARLIARLCVATSGLDPALDPHLDRLRDAARAGSADQLLRQARAFAGALAKMSDKRSPAEALRALLGRGSLQRREIDEAVGLWADIAASPKHANERQLDRLGSLIQAGLAASPSAAAAASPAAKGGLLARLMGKDQEPRVEPPNRRLLNALQQVKWPDGLRAEVEEFEAKLSSDVNGDAWVGVMRQIGALLVRAFDQVQANARFAEEFLNTLNRHLLELDQHMNAEGERRAASRASGERLGKQMRDEVGDLSRRVHDSADITELRAAMLGGLERIHGHLRDHLDEENARREKAEAEASKLREELHQLEHDTFDLRRKVARTHEQAMRDPLTGLPNRRAYDERVAQEYARWKRFGDPLALLVWDVDDFKKINDEFGHKAGDKALTMIGKLLRERLRETDFIARYGGEEIVVLLIGARAPDAHRLAEEMRVAVENGGLHAHSRPVRVTISGGLTLFAGGDSPDEVFERADAALYKAKRQGKNCVVMEQPADLDQAPR